MFKAVYTVLAGRVRTVQCIYIGLGESHPLFVTIRRHHDLVILPYRQGVAARVSFASGALQCNNGTYVRPFVHPGQIQMERAEILFGSVVSPQPADRTRHDLRERRFGERPYNRLREIDRCCHL